MICLPKGSEHAIQAAHNEGLLSEAILCSSPGIYCDWVVTISFYAALHLVDRFLAEKHNCIDIGTHDRRRSLMSTHLSSGRYNIFTMYETLQNDSRRARYDCATVTEQNAKDARSLLNQMKAKLK